TQTAGTVAPGGDTPTTNAATGASGFGNFDSPMQWEASSSNNVPTTAPMVTPSGSGGWSQPTMPETPSVYSAGSGQSSGSSQTWSQPTTPDTPTVWTPTSGQSSSTGSQGWAPPTSSGSGNQGWTPPTSGGSGEQGWTPPTSGGSENQGWTPTSVQGSGTGDQGWTPTGSGNGDQGLSPSSNAGPPSTGDSSGYDDGTLGVDCSGSSEGGVSPGYDMSLECSGSDEDMNPDNDYSLECSGSDEEEPSVSTSTAGSSNTTPSTTTAPTTSSESEDQGSSDTATSGGIEEPTPATSTESSGTGDQGWSQATQISSASSSNTESSSNTAPSPESSSNTAQSSATQEGSDATQGGSDATQQGGSDATQTSTSTGKHAPFGTVTSKSGGCVIGDPDTNAISTKDVNWIFENRMGVNQTNNKNWIFDHIVKGKGTLNYCVRWDSTQKLSKTVASQFKAMLERQYAAWNRWLIGYGCWPYDEIKVNMVGFAVKDASLLDWKDDSLGTIYAGDLDAEGVPQCPQTCYNFFDNGPKTWSDTSACKGEPFDLSLWPKQGLEGGFGYDWGQEVNLENMLQTLDQEILHIVCHEIGHGFGLPDFYSDAEKPSKDMGPAIMMAGSSMTVTDIDGWMLRRGYESVRDRYSFK
ncbi:hypothetical protein F441_03751, partial [Phytophthora nicotianae CJ01A1]